MPDSNLFADKKAFFYLICAFVLGGGASYLAQKEIRRMSFGTRPPDETHSKNMSHTYKIERVHGYRNINPVISVETTQTSERFASMKEALNQLAENLKTAGTIHQASVYIKEFDRGEWTSLNPEEKYHPASLMKVVLMLGYLRFAENTPDLFEQQWLFDKSDHVQEFPQYYADKTIESGKKYTVHELLYYMIAHSDNNATWMLASRLDKSHLRKIYAELGLKAPAEFDMNILMDVKAYSTFINAIYNASNLSPEYADYAADLLRECSYKEGFYKGFPADTPMWHKFGQWKSGNHDHELHESGLVYIKGKPYLITIMTKGKDTGKLAEAIRAFCKKIHDEIPAP